MRGGGVGVCGDVESCAYFGAVVWCGEGGVGCRVGAAVCAIVSEADGSPVDRFGRGGRGFKDEF